MKQPGYILSNGTRVRTNDVLESGRGIFVRYACMVERVPGEEGIIVGVVPGHGGDVYWVHHEGANNDAPYCFTEFEVIP